MMPRLYSSSNNRVMKSRRMRWAGHMARMGRGEVHTGFWRGKPEGKRALGRLMHKWEDNIKMGAWNGLIWHRMLKDGGLL